MLQQDFCVFPLFAEFSQDNVTITVERIILLQRGLTQVL